ncbi:response regulator transcription factor [Clostridium guangxiense]|uniref:response regulator transcription factor n=1 Tax=Clostridium guangxiense TaxID=1662055 RepID=UPI001E5BDD18|nr:response regulator [Clostridium guangxiense]MCD2345520.1 response regulator [Clostridium guangxiense]
MLNLLIVDDEFLVRKGLRQTIDWQGFGIQIVGEASNGTKGLTLAEELKPDIILTDVKMPIMNGLEFMQKLKEKDLNPKIIILSGYEDFNYVRTAMHNGAVAYLLKPIDNNQLTNIIKDVINKITNEKNTKKYIDTLKDEIPAITKQFLSDLVSGDITDIGKINEKICFLNISVDFNNCYIVVLKINKYQNIMHKLSIEELNKFKYYINKLISTIFIGNSAFNSIFINRTEEEFLIIIDFKLHNSNELQLIKVCCTKIVENLKLHFKETISIGISNLCTSVLEINKTYKDALTACQNKLSEETSTIIHINDISFNGYRREIKETIKYIQDNYNNNITVEHAAKELYISPSYLMHILKKDLGKTFNECLTDYRITMAKKLLLNRKYKIYEVSTRIGYRDVKYFSQIFKKTTGMTPSEYIKAQF